MSKTASADSLTRESLERGLMSARIARVSVTQDMIALHLEDGRILGMPTAWSPRLKTATLDELRNVEVTGRGTSLHWPDLDEDVNVRGILLGRMSAEGRESEE